MKFLLVTSYAKSILNLRRELLETLQQKGYEIHVAAPEFESEVESVQHLLALGWKVHGFHLSRKGIRPWEDLKTLVELFNLIGTIKPELILAYTIKPVIYASLTGWLKRIPQRYALITGLGYTFQEKHPNWIQQLAKGLYWIALRKVTKVFFQNSDDEDLFRRSKLLPEKIHSKVINGSGVNLEHFTPTPFPQRISFLLIARLLVAKGIREYANALRILHSKNKSFEAYLVGWHDEGVDAIHVNEFNIWKDEGLFAYLGSQPDVRPALSNCSVYVLPSYREGTPRTVLEAMSMGRPIITTDAPGCRETVIDGYNGFLVPPRDVNALVEAMLRFVDKPELITIMGQRSRQLAEEKYDVHEVNAVMLREMELA